MGGAALKLLAPGRFERACDGVRERRYYERPGTLARGPFGPTLLGGGPLGDSRLALFEALLVMDPFMASLHGALPEASHPTGEGQG